MPMPRLLIVNCASPYFFYIPMGAFGLCDYLGQQGIEARIFNPALFPQVEARKRLLAALDDLQPSHVGFACHWQETVHGLLDAVQTVRAWSRDVTTFAGGFTASYFAEDLLRTVVELNSVVTGDPEEPVAHLLQGRPPATIANLVWRRDGQVVRNDHRWLMPQPLLDRLAFADCTYLLDAERYLEKISTKLGFPLLLGRGCVFDCAYCGGSRHAFARHSARSTPVARSIAAILADMHLLRPRTTTLYICYENDQTSVKALLRAIGDDPHLRGHFTLHYGAWHLLDREFLDLYRRAFACTATLPIFEFSPEVTDDAKRQTIKRGSTYSLAGMAENFQAISAAFAGQVRIEVFFSRYHPALSAADLARETGAILAFKHRMRLASLPVHVCYDHLSTDVASRYWEEYAPAPRDFARFLEIKNRVDTGSCHPFPVDNLCLLIPSHLSAPFVLHLEALLFILERLERHCHELVQVLLAWSGDRWLDQLAEVLAPRCEAPAVTGLFAEPPLEAIVAELGQRLFDAPDGGPPFFADLLRFTRTKLIQGSRAPSTCPAVPGTSDANAYYLLDLSRITIHEQDYLDLLPLLQRMHEHGKNFLPYQRTVCLFLDGGILTISHAAYRETLKPFEQPRSLPSHRAALRHNPRIDWQRQEQLLDRLIEEGLLRPVAPPVQE